jgi:hypothetical protein
MTPNEIEDELLKLIDTTPDKFIELMNNTTQDIVRDIGVKIASKNQCEYFTRYAKTDKIAEMFANKLINNKLTNDINISSLM